MLESIEAGLDTLIDEAKEKDPPLKREEIVALEEKTKSFIKGLHGEGRKMIKRGFQEMGEKLEKELIPSWESSTLKSHVSEKQPEMVNFIESSFKAFIGRSR
jgi:hypothetical protein